MKGNKQSRRDAKQLFQACQVNGALDEARVRQALAQARLQRRRGAGAERHGVQFVAREPGRVPRRVVVDHWRPVVRRFEVHFSGQGE